MMVLFPRTRHIPPSAARLGQALVEFVMVMPILLLLLLGAYLVGMGIYTGATASMAIKAPMMRKLDLANNPGLAVADAEQMVRNYRSGNLQNGSPIQSMSTTDPNMALTTVLIGTQRFTSPVPFLPSVDFVVTQGMNSNLLLPNSAPTRPLPSIQDVDFTPVTALPPIIGPPPIPADQEGLPVSCASGPPTTPAQAYVQTMAAQVGNATVNQVNLCAEPTQFNQSNPPLDTVSTDPVYGRNASGGGVTMIPR